MLPAAHRLKGDAQFKVLAYKGQSFFSPLFSLKILRSRGVSRFGFVVSSRVSKKAVVRNRLRRQAREIIRLALPSLADGYMILILMKPQAVGRTYAELKDELLRLLSKARISNQ